MDYIRRHYEDVAESFVKSAKSPDMSLFGLVPLSNKVSLGVNKSGMWLWHIDAQESFSLKLFPRNCQIGFFEWAWIREIQVSYSRKAAFIFFNDLKAVMESVVIEESRKQVEKRFLHGRDGDRHLEFPLTSERHFAVLEYVATHHYAKVYKVE